MDDREGDFLALSHGEDARPVLSHSLFIHLIHPLLDTCIIPYLMDGPWLLGFFDTKPVAYAMTK